MEFTAPTEKGNGGAVLRSLEDKKTSFATVHCEPARMAGFGQGQ